MVGIQCGRLGRYMYGKSRCGVVYSTLLCTVRLSVNFALVVQAQSTVTVAKIGAGVV